MTKDLPYIIITVLAVVAYLWCDFSGLTYNDIVFSSSVDISGILFGFLITVLVLLLQFNGEGVVKLKKYNRFYDLININKRAIIFTGIFCLYSLSVVIIKQYDFFYCNRHFSHVISVFYFAFLFLVFYTTYDFVSLFFKVLSEDEKSSKENYQEKQKSETGEYSTDEISEFEQDEELN